MRNAVIVLAKRTVIGKKGGYFKDIPPEDLASIVIKDIIKTSKISPKLIDDVILGNVVGPGGNIARLSALKANLPISIPGLTIDRQCGSGLEAIRLACYLVKSGASNCILAGGVESCSLSPYDKRARFSPEEIGDPDMGVGAENVAEIYNITREMQDEFAISSYKKTLNSLENNAFIDEIVSIDDRYLRDEGIKEGLDYERLIKKVRPIFKKNGTVTLGNSCGVNDGASIVLVMEENMAKEMGFRKMIRFVDAEVCGVNPNLPGIGPVPAVNKLLEKVKLTKEDIDLVEFNEAFSAQVVASIKALNIPFEKVNVGGGAISIGHPYGASGAILVTRLFTELNTKNKRYGLATLGIGGGMGIACLFER